MRKLICLLIGLLFICSVFAQVEIEKDKKKCNTKDSLEVVVKSINKKGKIIYNSVIIKESCNLQIYEENGDLVLEAMNEKGLKELKQSLKQLI
jgi:hypothetical protein